MTIATLSNPETLEVLDMLPKMVRALLILRGQIATLQTEREAKTRKGHAQVYKQAKFQCRIGVNYDNIQDVKDKREAGILPAENAGLPWGQWVDGLFPYVIAHKGNHYFRCTTLNNNVVPEVHWFQNGQEITRDQARLECLASEFQEDKDNDVFVVKVESIQYVNGKAV